jgi:5'-methylthioadenosine phosphorylase
MTAIPEAKLAREAEICYATLAFVTDYDCWNEDHETVSTEMIIDNLKQNVNAAGEIIKKAVSRMPDTRDCGCATALANTIVTDPARIPAKVKKDLAPLIGKYIK